MSTKKTIEERIEAHREEKRKLEAKIQELLQEQRTHKKKEDDKRRFKRGEMLENYLPEIINLTDEQFLDFIDKCLLTDYTSRSISKIITSDNETEAKANSDETQNETDEI